MHDTSDVTIAILYVTNPQYTHCITSQFTYIIDSQKVKLHKIAAKTNKTKKKHIERSRVSESP